MTPPPCFADRFNLLRELVKPGTTDSAGNPKTYTYAEIADALPRTAEGRRPVSESRLRQLAGDRDTSPSVQVAGWIAQGFAELVRRRLPPGAEPVSSAEFKYYLMIDEGSASPEERAQFDRLHQQFTHVLSEQVRRAGTVSALGRFVELETPESRERVLKALDAALRKERKPGLWDRLRRGGKASPDED